MEVIPNSTGSFKTKTHILGCPRSSQKVELRNKLKSHCTAQKEERALLLRTSKKPQTRNNILTTSKCVCSTLNRYLS